MSSIRIDTFKKQGDEDAAAIYVLTHAHIDHSGGLPKSFVHTVYCSPITQYLLQESYPNVNFQGILISGVWTLLKNRLVYCFDSKHSIGGIGLVVPDAHLVHFGDGRPSESTVTKILEITKLFKVHNIDIRCDRYFENLQDKKTCDNFPTKIPTHKESMAILSKFLLKHVTDNIHIKVAHFGTLSCLPKRFTYKWLGSNSTPGSTLTHRAFKLLFPQQQQGNITVSSAFDRDYDIKDGMFDVTVVLSANWWYHNCETDLFTPMKDDKNQVRIFVCAHASQDELITRFQSLCKGGEA